MAIPTSKSELLDAINFTFDKLMSDLERVPMEYSKVSSMDGHVKNTHMSPANLAAYLIGWTELVLKWLERDDCGQQVDFPEIGFKWNQLGLLAQKFYTDFDMVSWPDLLTRLRKAKTALTETVAFRSNDELYGQPWHGKWTKGRMIQFNSSSPYINARKRIRKWIKSEVSVE